MFGTFKVYGVVIGGVVMVGGGAMYHQANDLKKNYTLVDAVITEVELDCFVKRGKKKLVFKDTNDLAYMDCMLAPMAAAQHDFDADDVQERATITYRYKSPVDNRRYTGTYKREGDIEMFERGVDIRVHAHNTEPEKSRTSKGNLFINDTGT